MLLNLEPLELSDAGESGASAVACQCWRVPQRKDESQRHPSVQYSLEEFTARLYVGQSTFDPKVCAFVHFPALLQLDQNDQNDFLSEKKWSAAHAL